MPLVPAGREHFNLAYRRLSIGWRGKQRFGGHKIDAIYIKIIFIKLVKIIPEYTNGHNNN